MLIESLSGLFLLLSGGLAGVLIGVEVAVVPMLGALPGDGFVRVHRLLDPRFDPLMPRANKLALAVGVALIVLAGGIAAKLSFALAEVCVIGVAVVSEMSNVRINRRIDTWRPDDLPGEWPSVRIEWFRANRLRTLFSLVGFAAAIIGTIQAAT